MSTITVLGGSGFIGRHLIEYLRQHGLPCFTPTRSTNLRKLQLGNVIYCIGLTADFRSKPFHTVEAHVCNLLHVLRDCEFDSFLYLSSSRVYGSLERQQAHEFDPLQVEPSDPEHVYNISKVMGESLSLNSDRVARVVRLSNVYGDDFTSQNFLSTIIQDAVRNQKVVLKTSLDSEKDYISVDDVVRLLVKIATGGRDQIYNLASGVNVSNLEITNRLSEITGCQVEAIANAPTLTFPLINVDRLKNEFGFQPAGIVSDLKRLVESFDIHS